MKKINLDNRQIEQVARYCLDISKAVLSSWVLVIFFDENIKFKILIISWGLFIASLLFIISINLFKEKYASK